MAANNIFQKNEKSLNSPLGSFYEEIGRNGCCSVNSIYRLGTTGIIGNGDEEQTCASHPTNQR